MKARKIYWAFLLVFLIAAIWLQTTGALGEAFWGLYGIIIAGFFVGGVFVNRRYLQDLEKEVKEMNPLLEQEPDKYIDVMEKALQGQRSRAMQAMLLTQIGKGYMAKGDYETAKNRLLTVPPKGLNPVMAQEYYIMLGLTLFHLDKDEAARKLLVLKATDFDRARQNPEFAHYYHILQVLAMVSEANRTGARKYLAELPELEERDDCKKEMKFIHQKL